MGVLGAVGEAATKGIAEGADKAISAVYAKMEPNSFGKGAIDFLFSMNESFKNHPQGAAVKSMISDGIVTRAQQGDKALAPIHQFQQAVKTDPKLALKFNYKKTDLKTIQGTLRAENHPAAQHLAPLMADSTNHDLNLHELEGKQQAYANMVGRSVALGPKSINLAATLHPMLKSADPREQTKATAWLEIISQIFKDTQNIPGVGVRSEVKHDVGQYVNRLEREYGNKGAELTKLDISPEYSAPGGFEKGTMKYGMNYLAPLIATAHLADMFKLGTFPAKALMKSLTQMGDKDLNDTVTASGIFSHTLHSIYHNDFEYRTGLVSRMTGQPGLTAILNKTYHAPLFNNLRMLQLRCFGTAAYHSAQMWGKQAVHGDKRALSELGEMNLDVDSIIKRGGDLTEDEIQKAVFHYTNSKLFVDRPLDRSRLAQKNGFFRAASLFHGYLSREGTFISHELSKLMKAQDYLGIAQFAGTVGIVFPACAPMLKSLSIFARTASPSAAWQEMKDDYNHLFHPKTIGEFVSTYIEMLAHFGGAGAYMSYVHAAENHRTAGALLGPVGGAAANIADDAATAAKGSKRGKHTSDAFKRDLLHYGTIPIFGNWTAEHMLPKRKRRTHE
jgi:hypothetical protein